MAVKLHTQYIPDGLKHLRDTSTYLRLSESQALEEDSQLRQDIKDWISEFSSSLHKDHISYIEAKLKESEKEPFGYFYLLYKLHKKPIKTRPVCSDCASTPHALGRWVDETLQPLVRAQATYFKDSFTLKSELCKLKLPANTSILSFGAVSMYTKIDTEDCISRLSKYLSASTTTSRFNHYSPEALITAIKLVLRNNRMKFGDIIVRQLVGIAMGMSPAPSLANLYVALHEERAVLPFLGNCVFYLKRFIDDGLCIWLHDPDPEVDALNWSRFQTAVTSGGLDWTFTQRSQSVDFMDMTIKLVGSKVETTLFEKPLALHLYIPPHSCHAPGVSISTVMGKVLRIIQLCTHKQDVDEKLKTFFGQLLDRGY